MVLSQLGCSGLLMRAKLKHLGCPDFPEDLGLTIFSYTLESPNFYSTVNDEMHSPGRASGLSGISDGMRCQGRFA